MDTSLNNNPNNRIFYQTLMAVAFALDTNHRYNRFLRFTMYVSIVDWTVSVSKNYVISNLKLLIIL